MEFSIDLDPEISSKLVLRLYRNVKNIQELRKKLFSNQISCCIIKPTLIYDPFQIVVAANKALIAEKLTTKSIYTEILFNLSISKNITQSLQKFGIDENGSDLLIAVINKSDESNGNDDLYSNINGDQCDLSELNKIHDLNEIKKAYKITEIESKDNCILDSVVSRIAAKDVL